MCYRVSEIINKSYIKQSIHKGKKATNHNPCVVYSHLTTCGLWYNVYTCTTEYTTNHIPLVVYRHHTTGELWYNVYTTEYTTNHNPLVVYSTCCI